MRKNAYEDEIEQLRAFIEDGGAPPAGLEGISAGEARQRAMRLFEELPPPALDSEPGPPMSRQDRAEDWWKHRAMVLDEIEKMTAFVEGRGPLPMNWQNTENLSVAECRKAAAEVALPALYEDLEDLDKERPPPRPPRHQ